MSDHSVARWPDPDSYAGARWPAFYSAGFGETRDSHPLTQSNFAVALRALEALNTPCATCERTDVGADWIQRQREGKQRCPVCHGQGGTVIVVRENHWACGWVAWIAIHESNAPALAKAKELCDQANDYPALDEDDWSERETAAVDAWWDGMSLKERVNLCAENDESIFSARRNYPPDRVQQALRENL